MKERKIKKITVLRLIKTIVFFSGVAALICLFSIILRPKDNSPKSGILNPNARGFYGEPENTIDIAVIGNSDAYSGFSPMRLWNEYGYTSYVAAEGAQNIGESVNILKEMLTCQSPDLVVLDVDCLWAGEGLVDQLEGNMKSVMYNYLPLYRYHDRWKQFSFDNMFDEPEFNWSPRTKGQWLSRSVTPYEGEDLMTPSEEKFAIPKANLIFLDYFFKVCEENEIPVLLVALPSGISWTYEKHNSMTDFAKERNLDFIDLNVVEGEYAIDWSQDTRDGGKHLNCYGAEKVTGYIGAYIHSNYTIEDKRGNEAYKDWDVCYEQYRKYMNGEK